MERDDSRHCSACDGHGRDDPVAYDCDHVATIAALRDALDRHHAFLLNGVQECGLCKRAALAAAKETP